MKHRTLAAAVLAAALTAACSGSSPTAASSTPPTSTPPPAAPPALVNLTGTVHAFDGTAISGATVTILDGANAGKVTTSTASGGAYSFTGLTAGTASVSAARTDLGFTTQTVSAALGGTLNFVLQAPVFSTSGTGANVFNMPAYVARVRIQGAYSGFCENFIVRINGTGVVNEILGTCSSASGPRFDGTFLVPNQVKALPGQQVQVTNSTGLNWTFDEVR